MEKIAKVCSNKDSFLAPNLSLRAFPNFSALFHFPHNPTPPDTIQNLFHPFQHFCTRELQTLQTSNQKINPKQAFQRGNLRLLFYHSLMCELVSQALEKRLFRIEQINTSGD
jgi:hypothetical protein